MPVTDFDFLPGRWDIVNPRPPGARRPSGTTFAATSHAEQMLGGGGNLDHFHTAGYEGFSLRLYDPE